MSARDARQSSVNPPFTQSQAARQGPGPPPPNQAAYTIAAGHRPGNRPSIETQLLAIIINDPDALQQYFTILDDDERQWARANEERRREDPPAGGERNGGNGGLAGPGGPPGAGASGVEGLRHQHRRRHRGRHRHRPSPSPLDGSTSPSRSRSRSRSPRRERPNRELFAWTALPHTAELDHTRILQQTLDIRRNYTCGGRISYAVRDLLDRPNLPNFPSSLWKRVLSDEYLDLKKVIGGLEALEPDRREVTVIGGLEIGHGREPPSKAILSSGVWVVAFDTVLPTPPDSR